MNNPEDANTVEKDLGDYAWKYFEFHANQRLTTFNFYIAVSGLVTTGLVASFHKSIEVSYLGIALGLLLVAFSYIFWNLDARNRLLVSYGEEALMVYERRFEENGNGNTVKIVYRELQDTRDHERSRNRLQQLLIPYRFTYSFRAIFLIFMVIGALGIIASVVDSWPVLIDWF